MEKFIIEVSNLDTGMVFITFTYDSQEQASAMLPEIEEQYGATCLIRMYSEIQ